MSGLETPGRSAKLVGIDASSMEYLAMSKVRTAAPSSGRGVLTLAIIVYFVAWLVIFTFTSCVFGSLSSIKLSIIVVLPLAIAARMRTRWSTMQGRGLSYFFILVIVVFVTVVGVVWNWYSTGMDRYHNEDVEYKRFAYIMRKDPSFCQVNIYVSRKHVFWLRGTVATDADLARLRALEGQCRFIRWNEELEVSTTVID